jgi:hypothetical protein
LLWLKMICGGGGGGDGDEWHVEGGKKDGE